MTDLEYAFGQVSGSTPQEAAKNSSRKFIVGSKGFGIYEGKGTGEIISAVEALKRYGLDKIIEAVDKGSAIL